MSANEELTIMAVGDIMTGCGYFHSLVGDSIPHVLGDPDRSLFGEEVQDTLRGADLTFGNLECVVTEEFDVESDEIPRRLMGPAETVPLLSQAGFDVLNLANNHILDHGSEYVLETVAHLNEHGLDYVGNPLEDRDAVTYSIKGHEVTFDGYYLPDLDDEAEKDRIRTYIRNADTEDRFDIVSLHWGLGGTEHMSHPSPEQVSFARSLIDSGVDVILGHHSHTFQPVEKYGDGVIAYSLGNFVFDMWREKNRKSGILKLVIDDEIEASILPTEQVDYRVGFTDAEFIREIQNQPVEWEATEPYRTASSRVRRSHKVDVLKQFAANSYRFPPSYHVSTYRRWVGKAKHELSETVAGVRQ